LTHTVEQEIWTAGYKYSWRKMGAAALELSEQQHLQNVRFTSVYKHAKARGTILKSKKYCLWPMLHSIGATKHKPK